MEDFEIVILIMVYLVVSGVFMFFLFYGFFYVFLFGKLNWYCGVDFSFFLFLYGLVVFLKEDVLVIYEECVREDVFN